MDSKAASGLNSVSLRLIEKSDLLTLFQHQREPEGNAMAAFPPRERDAFEAHWEKILSDEDIDVRAILEKGEVAGNVLSWTSDGRRFVGYWLGKDFWGRGIATKALIQFLDIATSRPLYAHVSKSNAGSIRVLQKCGFKKSRKTADNKLDVADQLEEFVYALPPSSSLRETH